MRAATVVQQLCKPCRTCFMFYRMFYFTCDRSFILFTCSRLLSCTVCTPSGDVYRTSSVGHSPSWWADRWRLLLHRLAHQILRPYPGIIIPSCSAHTLSRRGQGRSSPPTPQKKSGKKYFSGKYYVKFGHFVNFSYIFSCKNVLPQSGSARAN